MVRVLAAVDDLFFGAKIAETAGRLNVPLVLARSPEELEEKLRAFRPGTLGCAGLPSCQKNLALLAPWRLVFSLALFQRNPDDHPNRYAAVILPEEHEFLHPGEVPRLFRIGS